MSDINTNPPTGQEFEEYPDIQTSVLPDFGQLMAQKLSGIKQQANAGFDPHKLMVQKKQVNSGEVVDNTPKREWPEKDTKALEDFCREHGILGFNSGKMSPIAALAILKKKMGIVDGPLEQRVPIGYEQFGAKSTMYNQVQTYSAMVKKKSVLHG